MRWTERQQLMLREMGLRLWVPPSTSAAEEPAARLLASEPARPEPTQSPASPAKQAPAREAVAQTPSHATAHMGWPELQQAVQACQACGLCETRRNTVFGVGHHSAHCMIVGEAPGENEDLQGEPFVGAAGQLLDRMLAALGLSRQAPDAPSQASARQVFIANTLKCRPPRNRNPSPEELLACQPFLERQVALVQPKVIIAMGRFAVQSLLASDEPIGKLRGRVHAWRGVPLVVTYHPAYLLRQPADKSRAWDDLCLAAQHLNP